MCSMKLNKKQKLQSWLAEANDMLVMDNLVMNRRYSGYSSTKQQHVHTATIGLPLDEAFKILKTYGVPHND